MQNSQGWSDWSLSTQILAANIPEQTGVPVVELVISSTMIKIDWEKPNERGDPIIEYEIQLLSSDGNFYILPEICDGTDPVVVTDTQCQFDMLNVVEEPLLLV